MGNNSCCCFDQGQSCNESPNLQRNNFSQQISRKKETLQTKTLRSDANGQRSSKPFENQISAEKQTIISVKRSAVEVQGKSIRTPSQPSRQITTNHTSITVKPSPTVPKDFELKVQEMLKKQQQVQNLLNMGCKAFQLNLWNQATELYCKAASILIDQRSNQQYSPETIRQTLAYIYQELIDVETARKLPQKAEKHYIKYIELYDNQPANTIIQEKITLLNNYSVFLREQSRLADAIEACKTAFELANKYYTFQDARRYHILINLAAFYQQIGNVKEAEQIYRQLENCRDPEIMQQASANKKKLCHSQARK